MEKVIIYILFLAAPNLLLGQNYRPFIEHGKVWEILDLRSDLYASDFTFHCDINNNRLVDGKTFYFVGNNYFRFYCREDTDKRQVYRLDTLTNKEKIVYDFGLVVSDSFYIYENYRKLLFKEEVIFSEVRNIFFTYEGEIDIVERVGSTDAFLFENSLLETYVICCYLLTGELIYKSFAYGDGCDYVSLPKSYTAEPRLYFLNEMNLLQIQNTREIELISIYNLQGEVFVNMVNRGNDEMQIPVQKLPSGMYIVRMTGRDKTWIKRIVLNL